MNLTAEQLLEIALKRQLTAAELAQWQTCLAAHPDQRAAWEEDLALNQLLRALPPAPVPSNFTAQVLRALDRDEATAKSSSIPKWLARLAALRWTRPVAFAALALVAGLFAWQQQRQHARTEVANSLRLPTLMRLPSMEQLKDFDAINSLSQTSGGGADVELLAALEREK